MGSENGIILNSHFDNKMAVNGELGWLIREFNASTGYTWRFTPDNSGVYELVEEIALHPSTEESGVPGKIMWKFKGVKAGNGSILLELYPPDDTSSVESTTIAVTVK
ncbi:MAG: protease inhibitor I42 family protein [Cyanobacteriota bacterium]|nr:protease inhibitor I42 family protein [Cyanobacteriota bacterium]